MTASPDPVVVAAELGHQLGRGQATHPGQGNQSDSVSTQMTTALSPCQQLEQLLAGRSRLSWLRRVRLQSLLALAQRMLPALAVSLGQQALRGV